MVLWCGFLGFILGCFAAGPLYYYLPAVAVKEYGFLIMFGPPLLLLILGAVVGNGKAFDLRLRAQLALCQLQIERNTRAAAQR